MNNEKTARKRTKDINETLPYVFSDTELLSIGRKLAEANIDAERAEAEKKSVTSTLKAKYEGCIAKVAELSSLFTAGREYRSVVCTVTFDEPKPGMKEIRRKDNHDLVDTKAMTLEEMQQRLPGLDESAGD